MRLVGFVHFLQGQLNDFFEKCMPESGRVFEPYGRHKALTDVAGNYRHFWVMMDDEQEIVGTIAVVDLPYDAKYAAVMHRNSGEIKHLYLLNEFHGQGLGKKMVGFAIDQAKTFGYTWLYLDTMSSSETAIAIYKQFGFEEISRYNENPHADVFMRLKL